MTVQGVAPLVSDLPHTEARECGPGRTRWRRWRPDLTVALLFAVLALAFIGPALLPGRALLPIDALFGYPPWRAHAETFGFN